MSFRVIFRIASGVYPKKRLILSLQTMMTLSLTGWFIFWNFFIWRDSRIISVFFSCICCSPSHVDYWLQRSFYDEFYDASGRMDAFYSAAVLCPSFGVSDYPFRECAPA